MTDIVPLSGTQLLIKVGNGANPETFAHPCLINTKRGIKFTSSANKVIVPNCDDPDDPAWSQVFKDSLAAAIDGAGKFDNKTETIAFYDDWFRSPDPKSVQVWLGNKGYWQGMFHLTSWEITGDRNDNAECSISLESSGALGQFVPS